MAKIKYYINEKERTVIAVSEYHGRRYRANAKCAPEDVFDIELGKKLATLRLQEKIYRKMYSNSFVWVMETETDVRNAKRQREKALKYYNQVTNDINHIIDDRIALEKELGKFGD